MRTIVAGTACFAMAVIGLISVSPGADAAPIRTDSTVRSDSTVEAAGAAPSSGTSAKVSLPGGGNLRVTGPIPVTSTSHPFGAADHEGVPENLSEIGYVEQEYFVSGLANVYTWPAPGPAVVRTTNAPYTTRILVRRPVKASKFSGNVVVEPLNPSNLFDLNLGWALMHKELVRNGDVWVGITVKPVSMQTLKTFDPQRYAPLAMDNPLPLTDPNNCATVASDSSRSTENGLAWDMMTQVAQLMRATSARNPVHYGGRSATRKVYGFGYSQTGGYMYDYINGVLPLARQKTGRNPYDGYLVAVAGGAFVGQVPINQCATIAPAGDPRYLFSNVGVPIMHVMSQSDYLRGIAGRRPDSDAPSDRYRQYEMAGAGHATPDELNFSAEPADIVKGGRAVPPMDCNEGPRSRFPSQIFFDAVLHNLERWVAAGVEPPHGSPIVVENGQPVTDRFGNVEGGLRSPFLDVPTSTWFGSSTGPSFCSIAGHEVPFSQALLKNLYPTHRIYVRKVTADVRSLVAERFITAYDGRELIQQAKDSTIP